MKCVCCFLRPSEQFMHYLLFLLLFIDDESDYFASDSDKWLSKDQRQKLKEREKEIHEQKHGSRLE